jgi:hypothetical protein
MVNHLLHRIMRALRGPSGVAALCFFTMNGMQAPIGGLPSGTFGEADFLKWALTQGGLVLVLIVVFWSYRRDFVGILRQEQERTKILTDLVSQSTVALTRMADAVGDCPLKLR